MDNLENDAVDAKLDASVKAHVAYARMSSLLQTGAVLRNILDIAGLEVRILPGGSTSLVKTANTEQNLGLSAAEALALVVIHELTRAEKKAPKITPVPDTKKPEPVYVTDAKPNVGYGVIAEEVEGHALHKSIYHLHPDFDLAERAIYFRIGGLWYSSKTDSSTTQFRAGAKLTRSIFYTVSDCVASVGPDRQLWYHKVRGEASRVSAWVVPLPTFSNSDGPMTKSRAEAQFAYWLCTEGLKRNPRLLDFHRNAALHDNMETTPEEWYRAVGHALQVDAN